jgi:alpha,alpha-trehalose phosphorylase
MRERPDCAARLRARLAADPAAPWRISERDLEHDGLGAAESVFAVGNGYVGVRGTHEEGAPVHEPGVVLNGFHETWPIQYPEDAYGLARTGQTIVNATDGSVIRLLVDGEPFDLESGRVLRFERALDMAAGVLLREIELETAGGARVLVRSRRLASLTDRHLVAIDYEVTALDAAVAVALSSELVTHGPGAAGDDPRRGKGFADKVLVPHAARAEGTRALLQLSTRRSGLQLACGIEHRVDRPAWATARDDAAQVVVEADLAAGESLRMSKFVAYHWGEQASPELVERTLDRAAAAGYDAIEADQRATVADFWTHSDVQIDGAPEVQKAVRFNLFQLLQATALTDGGVPAKGVTGHGYEGHYFWDTEIYIVPFLAHTTPERAKRLLEFRCAKLPAARERAREVGHSGALFPWRTINGAEASAWYASGTAQYHINADIVHAMHQYNRVTGDLGFMLDQGAEVIFETARLWMELGFFLDGSFRINAVTGPDEYTTVVDNNAYTNVMAKQNLEIAVRITEWLAAYAPERHAALVADGEADEWRRAAEAMFVPRNEALGIVLQDEHFLGRKRWDFADTPPEKHPLLLHFHPLEIYRHQVIKQTDVVLATYLAGDQFTDDEIRRTFDYYDPLTTGDSTLSACIQSVIASQVGYEDAALDYFLDACAVDLIDAHGNTADGIHVASCGGTWLALVAGFGGLRDSDGDVAFSPRLPAGWDRLRFRVTVRGQLIEVDMESDATTYRLVEGHGIQLRHFGELLRLTQGKPERQIRRAALRAA